MTQRIVLITGANQGLGLEIAKKLVAENENYLLLMAVRDLSKGEQAIKSLTNRAKNTSVEPIVLDVRDDESIFKAAKQVEEKYGHLDVLLNNAGIVTDKNNGLREEMIKGRFPCSARTCPRTSLIPSSLQHKCCGRCGNYRDVCSTPKEVQISAARNNYVLRRRFHLQHAEPQLRTLQNRQHPI